MVSSIEQIDELSYVEKELEDLQSLIKQHYGAIEGLRDIQPQLSALSQFRESYQTASRQSEVALERLERSHRTLSDRADALETRIQKLSEDCAQVKRTMEQVLTQCAAEWAQQQQSVQTYIQDFEERSQNDLNHAINRLNRTGIDAVAQRDRLERLDTRVRGLSSSVKSIHATLKTWGGLAIVICAVGFLGILILMLLF